MYSMPFLYVCLSNVKIPARAKIVIVVGGFIGIKKVTVMVFTIKVN